MIAIGLAIQILCSFALAEERIDTPNGWIQFSPDPKWTVLRKDYKEEVPVYAAQIPNGADIGTPDSTNLVLLAFDKNSEKLAARLQSMVSEIERSDVSKSSHEGWTLYEQSAFQGAINYTVIDAVRPIADVVVLVRVAWPHLPANESGYDESIRSRFELFIDGTYGSVGVLKDPAMDVYSIPVPATK